MAIEVPHLTIPTPATTPAAVSVEDDPLWFKDVIIYQAHVKSFFDSDNDGVGDFRGLTQKLDYLQGLGITCLWLLPFFPSPLRDDGYDISDYRNVHPAYGKLDDFKALVAAARDRRIKILIELVVNHTSDQHPWFQRARHAPPGSPEREFYIWSDTDQQFPETRIIFTDTEKSNWTYDPVARQYYWHRFFSHQPDLNHNNPAVVDAVIDVMKFWLDPAFAPEPLTASALNALADGMRDHADQALELLKSRLTTLPESIREQANAVLADRQRLDVFFDQIRGLERAGVRMRVHGDYHLGQVLRTEEDFVIIDFEGEPTRTLEERRAKHSPLKDVAGMVRSFSYAAYAALFATVVHAPDRLAMLEPWADTWQHWVTDAFLSGYRSAMNGSTPMPPAEPSAPLFRAFLLDKAAYELVYELNSRPDWVRIPLTGMLKLLR